MTRNRCLTLLLSAVLPLLGGARPAAAAGPYKVVVNSANATSALSRDDVGRVFLKKLLNWPGGQPTQPVDQSTASAVRKAFSQGVLGKDVVAIESYWQQAIFSGRAVPPVQKSSDEDVLAYVRANPNAIGYVSGGADLGASVKELTVN